jgi:hypothetical protein
MDALERLHLGLTRGRELVGRPYLDDPELLAAYREHFSPMSYAKARAVLREIMNDGMNVHSVVDVGAGPGPMAQAAKEWFPSARVVACDRSARALALVPEGIERVRWDAMEQPPLGLPRADLVLLGNVLNELPGNPAEQIERMGGALLAEGGTIVIIEPALRETARALEQARDRLIERGWFVVAPCLWRGGCPALGRERDWCHEDRSMAAGRRSGAAAPARERSERRPAAAGSVEAASGSINETLKFAYLVLRREGQWPVDPCQYRVVSAKMEEKGRQKLWACGVRGRYLLTRLDRHASDLNGAWDGIARGDVVAIEGLEEKGTEELRVGRGSRVRVVLPVVRG